jgi:probable HAF family extracellular repeat protein
MTLNHCSFAITTCRATLLAALLSAGVIPAAAAVDPEVSASRYTIIDVGTPLGGFFAVVSSVEYNGVAGGYANLPDNSSQHAFQWRHGVTTDLGTFGGPNKAAEKGDDESKEALSQLGAQ